MNECLKKDLLILVGYESLESIDSKLLENCDRLAMTPGSMLAFEEKNLSYKTSNDFYGYKEFRIDNMQLLKEIEEVFFEIDKKYEPFLNFPRPFTANIYWFAILFADLHYVSKMCEAIKQKYEKVYLVCNSAYKGPFGTEVEFSSGGPRFFMLKMALKGKVSMIIKCLSPQCFWSDEKNKPLLHINLYATAYFISYVFKKILLKFKLGVRKLMKKKEDVILVIQDGYEINLLKTEMKDFLFIRPIEKLLRLTGRDNKNKLRLEAIFHRELGVFVEKWFPNFRELVFDLFTSYHKNILCRINFFGENIKKALDSFNPYAIFYSVGAVNIYEEVFAYFANQRNVPIFYFQHGGAATSAFSYHPYQKYIEHNKNIKKINILQSKIERNLLADNFSEESKSLGSIKLYNLYIDSRIKKSSRKIMYCTCPFTCYAYKDLIVNINDKELFEIDKDILSIINKLQLSMDIKIGVTSGCSWANDYSLYLKNLLRIQCCRSNIRILKGFPAEHIISGYGLIIFDYLVSTLIPVSIVLDVPVIMYLKDSSFIRRETRADIEQRFYVVKNRAGLEKCLDLYSQGALKSKFSIEMVDKYAFSVADENPSVGISNYIKSRIF